MAKKLPKGVILGVDGKPLPPSPRPKSDMLMVSTAGGGSVSDMYGEYMERRLARYSFMGMDLGSDVSHFPADKVEQAVKADPWAALDDVLVGLDDMESGVQELPEGIIDPTKYADAFYVAAKNCKHSNYEDTTYAKREAKCLDCGKYFKRSSGY